MAKMQIELLASNEKVRRQIEENSDELAGIIRGRGIDLESIQTSVESVDEKSGFSELASVSNRN